MQDQGSTKLDLSTKGVLPTQTTGGGNDSEAEAFSGFHTEKEQSCRGPRSNKKTVSDNAQEASNYGLKWTGPGKKGTVKTMAKRLFDCLNLQAVQQ